MDFTAILALRCFSETGPGSINIISTTPDVKDCLFTFEVQLCVKFKRRIRLGDTNLYSLLKGTCVQACVPRLK